MTQPAATPPSFVHDLRTIAATVAVPHHEPPSLILRRRIVVAVVLLIGGALLGYSLSRPAGDKSFFWL
ncbi:MAG: protease family protein, partial [Mycobacterium sp.]|nr:protease family protein [Mycobacterium sp.]